MKLIIPNDWNEEQDGYCLALVCIPNSKLWIANVKGQIDSLARGRTWNEETGIITDVQAIGLEIAESFMTCKLDELVDELKNITRTQRMLVASIVGEAINFDQQPNLPNAINYEGLYSIFKGISAKIDNDMTLAEVIAAMEQQDGPDYGFKDWLEILKLLQDIFPGAGLMPFSVLGNLWKSIATARINHNTLSIQAMQATYLRGIQNAISPVQDANTEETFIKGLWDTVQKAPWLTTAIIALVDPSPAGESALIIKAATLAKNIVTGLFTWLPNWWNQYINSVANPQPQGTVVGMLSEISRKVQSLTDEQQTPTVTISNRLKLIADAIEGIETNGQDLTPSLAQIVTALNSIALPEGVTWQGLFELLAQQMEESMPVINVTCSSCGSSGGCGCGGASSGAYGPGVQGPNDKPPIQIVQGQIPVGFPGVQEYNDYKCKAANVIVLNLAEMLAQLADFKNANLSQYTVATAAQSWIAGQISSFGAYWGGFIEESAGWISDKIMAFVWPYPSALALDLNIFSDIRLDWLDQRQENVCGLYTSYNTGEARDFIQGVVDGYIDATSYSSATMGKAKEIYKALLTNQFLNRLFEKDNLTSNYNDSSAIDCSQCEGDIIAYVDFYPCEPEVSNETGHFSNGTIIVVGSCVANLAGADRHSVIVQASPYNSGILRNITCSGLTNGTYSLNWLEEVGGTTFHVEGDQAFFEDYSKECISWNLVRYTDLLTPFSVTIQVDEIIE